MAAYVRVVTALSRAFGVFAMILLACAVLVVCEMIFVRYILRWSTAWQTEFVVYSIVAATFLGSPYVLVHRGHVNVDLLPNAAGPRGRFFLELAAGLVSLAFAALLAWSGWEYFHKALIRGLDDPDRLGAAALDPAPAAAARHRPPRPAIRGRAVDARPRRR